MVYAAENAYVINGGGEKIDTPEKAQEENAKYEEETRSL